MKQNNWFDPFYVQDYLTEEEYSKLYPQKRTLVACHGYFIFGGRDLKAIDRIFESFYFLPVLSPSKEIVEPSLKKYILKSYRYEYFTSYY